MEVLSSNPHCLWVLVTALLFDHLKGCFALLAAEVGHLFLSTFVFCFPELPAPSPTLMRDASSVPGLGSSPLQCSCLENPMHRGAWRAAVHGVAMDTTEVT